MTAPATDAAPAGDRRRHVVGYLVVGVLSYAIDLGLLVLLRDLAAAPLLVATSVGFWTSVGFNFTANRWVFRGSGDGSARAHVARYAALLVLNYGLTLGIVSGGVALGAGAVVSKTVAVAAIACLNFVAYRRWVFA